MSTTPIVPTPPPTSTTPTAGNGLPTGQSLNNMFLQLLVAQLKNQDPTSPLDPSQFVGQLAQFSELSEVTSIYQLLQQVVPASGSTGSTAGAGSAPGSGPATGAPAQPVASVTSTLDLAKAAAARLATPNLDPAALSILKGNIQGAF